MHDILNEESFDVLANMCMDAVIVIDSEEKVVYINDEYCNLTHIKRQDVIGKNISDLSKKLSRLPEVILSRTAMLGHIESYYNDDCVPENVEKAYYVNRKPIVRDNKVIGAIGYMKTFSTTSEIYTMIKQFRDENLFYRGELLKNGVLIDFDSISSKAEAMRPVKKMAMRVADSDFPVLLLGETGTGKEVFASAIHSSSSRKNKPLIKVNCAAIPEALIESELFGYEEGAFSGAKKGGKPGKFELANGGTIFLDEIGELPINIQPKLLRVLQEGEVERIGGTKSIKTNFRLLAATNQDLLKKIDMKEFREDLYYRISVVPIKIPPLRDRKEDIPDLIEIFLYELNHRYGTNKTITPLAKNYIIKQPFPGNVRELKNIVGRAFIMSESDVIGIDDLYYLQTAANNNSCQVDSHEDFDSNLQEERDAILSALKENNYNCAKTADILGITRMTLYRKIKKFKITLNRQ